MTKKEMKLSLKKAVMDASPDVLEQILSPSPQRMASVMEFKEERKTVNTTQRLRAAACALSLFLVLCVSAVLSSVPKVESVVSIDVNPSVELSVDRRDCVVEARPVNEDAEEILDDLQLNSKSLDTATDEIFQSMIQHGYLAPEKEDNTILISVANKDTQRAEEIQQKVSQSVVQVLKTNNTQAKLIQQKDVQPTDELRQFADQHNISVGKADYVLKITQTDRSLNPEELSSMSISQLSSIAEEKDLPLDDVEDPKEPPRDSGDQISSGESSGDSGQNVIVTPPSSLPESSDPSTASSVSNTKPGQVLEGNSSEQEETTPKETSAAQKGQYCEYCGRFITTCRNSCDRSEGKQFCPDCGRHLEYCVCPDKEVESGSINHEQTPGDPDSVIVTPPEETEDSSETSSDDLIQLLPNHERYCEYCGEPRSDCKNRCDRSGGRLYCSRCGRLKTKCTCFDSGYPG